MPLQRFVMRLRPCIPLLLFSCGLAAYAAETPPRLAVVISVDQLRADHLVRFRPYFGGEGFKRRLEGGAVFRDCHYRHAITQTAPGHGVILSGVYPNVHSVIGNEWIDRDSWEQVNAVEDRDAPLVGVAPRELGPAATAQRNLFDHQRRR